MSEPFTEEPRRSPRAGSLEAGAAQIVACPDTGEKVRLL